MILFSGCPPLLKNVFCIDRPMYRDGTSRKKLDSSRVESSVLDSYSTSQMSQNFELTRQIRVESKTSNQSDYFESVSLPSRVKEMEKRLKEQKQLT